MMKINRLDNRSKTYGRNSIWLITLLEQIWRIEMLKDLQNKPQRRNGKSKV